MAAPFQYLLNTLKVGTLEKLFFSNTQNPKVILFVNKFTADDKHYLLKRDNLAQRIQMKLSQKQKTFPEFFFRIFKIYIKILKFPKKRRPSQLMCFWKYWLRKNMLR